MFGLPTVPIGLELLIGIPLIFVIAIVFLLITLVELKRWAPEAFIIKYCRKNDCPALLREEIGTGLCRLIKGKKDKQESPIFEDPDGKSLYVDPAHLRNTKPQNWGNGLAVFHYATSQYTPLTTINILGINKVIEVGRTYPALGFLDDKTLVTFGKMRRDHLFHNVEVVLKRFQPEWDDGTAVSKSEMVQAVIDFQDALKRTRIDTDLPVASDAAFAANPVTHLVHDLGQIVQLIEELIEAKWAKRFQLMTYVIMALMMIGGVTVCAMALMYMK